MANVVKVVRGMPENSVYQTNGLVPCQNAKRISDSSVMGVWIYSRIARAAYSPGGYLQVGAMDASLASCLGTRVAM